MFGTEKLTIDLTQKPAIRDELTRYATNMAGALVVCDEVLKKSSPRSNNIGVLVEPYLSEANKAMGVINKILEGQKISKKELQSLKITSVDQVITIDLMTAAREKDLQAGGIIQELDKVRDVLNNQLTFIGSYSQFIEEDIKILVKDQFPQVHEALYPKPTESRGAMKRAG